MNAGGVEFERLRRERSLYRRLLELGAETDVSVFLEEALALVVELAEADQGFLEVGNEPERAWSIAHALSSAEVEQIQSRISRGIIARALATGETILTSSAILDPRFQERESVQLGNVQAVLCAPIGTDPPLGIVYLHGKGSFSDDARANVELFARHVAPIAHRILRDEQTRDDPTLPFRSTLRLEGVVGKSRVLAGLLRQVALVAPLEVSVLLTGESGTGKSQIARVIHDNGPRAGQAYVEINCAALPENLVESELFGAHAGAHSTATRKIEGKVAMAAKGTLFLDEVAELPLGAQAKLLGLIQDRQYYPLGSPRPETVDVRILAATNTDLREAVATKRFREDLFYRLQVLPIRVPTLAERRDDVAELVRHFADRACERHGLPHVEPSPGALRAVQAADWPGNVRQLAHATEAAVIRATGEGAAQIELRHLFPEGEDGRGRLDGTDAGLTFQEATRRFQADLLRGALEESEWNVSEVARRLDLARSHVYNLIRAFAIRRRD